MSIDANMTKMFDLVPVTEQEIEIVDVPTDQTPKSNTTISEDIAIDYDKTRQNIDYILEKGREALDYAMIMVKETQHPRWVEATSILLKNMSEANREFLETQKRLAEIKRNQETPTPLKAGEVNIDKAIFTGSSSDLIALLNPRKKDGSETL